MAHAGNGPADTRRKRRRSIGRRWSGAASTAMPRPGPSWWAAQQRRVYALCYRFTGSSHDAEDLTQDVFIKVYGNLRSFDPAKGSFHTWITTLTRNLLVDHFRRSRQQRVTDSIDAGWDQGHDAPGRAHRRPAHHAAAACGA